MVQYEIVVAWRDTGPGGYEEWTLRFGPPPRAPAANRVQAICIRGVLPVHLQKIRISDEDRTAFEIRTTHDTTGHPIHAGDIMKALYGLDDDGGLLVPAADFRREVRHAHALVEMCIRSNGSPSAANIVVFGMVE